ncbi:MAG: GTPase [Candidatus Micrarchaeia archaeon]
MPDKRNLQKKLEELKAEYSHTKYNKATNKHLSILRAKISRVNKAINTSSHSHGTGFSVKKSGDATVALVGFPNSGKSSILQAMTDAESKVANYAFTTVDLIPGMMKFKDAEIQLFDIPGLIEGAHTGKGEGAKIASAIKVADLVLLVIDAEHCEQLESILNELSMLGIKISPEGPKIRIEDESKGGISIISNGHSIPERYEVEKILEEFKVYNATVKFFGDTSVDELIDAVSENIIYINGIVALNKIDLNPNYKKAKEKLESATGLKVIPISALNEENLELLKEEIFRSLKLIRIYLKPRANSITPEPMIVREGSSISDIAEKVHSSAARGFKHAFVTGPSVKFANQKVGGSHIVRDGDIIVLIYKSSI